VAPGHLVPSPAAAAAGITSFCRIHRPNLSAALTCHFLRANIFADAPLIQLFRLTSFAFFVACPLAMLLGSSADYAFRRKLLRGVVRRGPRLVSRHTFNCTLKSDGIGFRTQESVAIGALLDPRYLRRLPINCAKTRRPACMPHCRFGLHGAFGSVQTAVAS
jgi:hypothetical protein